MVSTMNSTSSSTGSSEKIPINRPALRQWELGPENDRYDSLLAAPSDEELMKMWSWWLVITLGVTIFVLIVFIAMISNKKVRKNSFNTYLLFLMAPDLFLSASCVMTCILNIIDGAFYSEWSCRFQSFYLAFSIGANAWLNGIIAWQLHTMLRWSYSRRRYKMPSRRRVAFHAFCVYVWAGFVASWTLWDFPRWPHKTFLVKGEACVPLEYDTASTIFFYLVFFPAFAGVPLIYVCYILYDIVKHGLLPPTGKRRLIVIYFFRLIAVFTLMWVPALLLIFVIGSWVPPWVTWAGGSWSHFQGAVSAAVSMVKPDIAEAVMDLICCFRKVGGDDDERDGWAITSVFKTSLLRSSLSRISLNRSSFGLPVSITASDIDGTGKCSESVAQEIAINSNISCAEEEKNNSSFKIGVFLPDDSSDTCTGSRKNYIDEEEGISSTESVGSIRPEMRDDEATDTSISQSIGDSSLHDKKIDLYEEGTSTTETINENFAPDKKSYFNDKEKTRTAQYSDERVPSDKLDGEDGVISASEMNDENVLLDNKTCFDEESCSTSEIIDTRNLVDKNNDFDKTCDKN